MHWDVLEEAAGARGGSTDDAYEQAVIALVETLKAHHYDFITPTPASHARVIACSGQRVASDLRDIFGWSMPFDASLLGQLQSGRELLDQLIAAGIVDEAPAGLSSRLRVSSLGPDLLLHSAYPTDGTDAVFFGPDSYRFARLITRELGRRGLRPGARLIDIGTGTGAGAITAAHLCSACEIAMTDINPAALRLALINARIAGVPAAAHLSSDLSPLIGAFDLILANPPYIIDAAARAYRHGGGMHGSAVSLEMAIEAVPRLAPGGRFILYTGSAIVGGKDGLRDRLVGIARDQGCTLEYAEIDPDVFGEELGTDSYRDVERIALVSAVIERPGMTT